MTLKKIAFFFTLISLTSFLSAQSTKHLVFSGKIHLEEGNAKNVTIKAYDGNKCFSTYETKSSGKFFFEGKPEKQYTLEFKKDGYVTKYVIIKTHNTRKLEKNPKKYKFDIDLFQEETAEDFHREEFPVVIIELDKKTKEFCYNKKYNDQFQRTEDIFAAK